MQTKIHNDIVEVIELPNLESFIDCFGDSSIINKLIDTSRNAGKYGIIFRGQADSQWDLIPKILREKDLKNVEDMNKNYPNSQKYEPPQIKNSPSPQKTVYGKPEYLLMTELQILRNFYNSCSFNGLKIDPISEFDSRLSNSIIIEKVLFNSENWYLTDKHESLATLAQHYGIPTRLLDFTYDVYTALYFATKDAIKISLDKKTIDYNKKISIWTMFPISTSTDLFIRNGLKIIQPIYANNPNLYAQKGLLVYWNIKKDNDLIYEPSLINITKNFDFFNGVNKDFFIQRQKEIFKRFELPYSEIPKIWSFLLQKECNATKYFPGYHSIIEEMNEWKMLNDINELVGKV